MTAREIVIGESELVRLLERAAHDGARRVLHELGLADENAPGDLRELRGLLEGWRDFKKTVRRAAWKTITRWVIWLLLAVLFYAAGAHQSPLADWLRQLQPGAE
jgi:Family of unknown function (DUF6127)